MASTSRVEVAQLERLRRSIVSDVGHPCEPLSPLVVWLGRQRS